MRSTGSEHISPNSSSVAYRDCLRGRQRHHFLRAERRSQSSKRVAAALPRRRLEPRGGGAAAGRERRGTVSLTTEEHKLALAQKSLACGEHGYVVRQAAGEALVVFFGSKDEGVVRMLLEMREGRFGVPEAGNGPAVIEHQARR